MELKCQLIAKAPFLEDIFSESLVATKGRSNTTTPWNISRYKSFRERQGVPFNFQHVTIRNDFVPTVVVQSVITASTRNNAMNCMSEEQLASRVSVALFRTTVLAQYQPHPAVRFVMRFFAYAKKSSLWARHVRLSVCTWSACSFSSTSNWSETNLNAWYAKSFNLIPKYPLFA